MSSLNVFLLPHQRLGLHAQIGQSETRGSVFSLDAEKPPKTVLTGRFFPLRNRTVLLQHLVSQLMAAASGDSVIKLKQVNVIRSSSCASALIPTPPLASGLHRGCYFRA